MHDQARNDAFMFLMDALLLIAVLAVAAVWIVAPRSLTRVLRMAPLALAGFATLQFTAEGFYWQLLPTWLLIAVMDGLQVQWLLTGMDMLAAFDAFLASFRESIAPAA